MKYDERDPNLRIDLYDKLYAGWISTRDSREPLVDAVFARMMALALRLCDQEAREDERRKMEKENEAND